jgi:hypothetical protein
MKVWTAPNGSGQEHYAACCEHGKLTFGFDKRLDERLLGSKNDSARWRHMLVILHKIIIIIITQLPSLY